jgi:plastocyanin domain-containing protein
VTGNSEEVVILAFGKPTHLPENQTVVVEVKPETPGEYESTCGMGMYRGNFVARRGHLSSKPSSCPLRQSRA